MPAMPIADSSAPIVVGISDTSSAISVAIETSVSGELRERPQRHDHHQEDQRQAREQDPERDLVRRLAPLGALDQRDHAVEEALARLLGDLDDDAVRQHARAARDGAAVAAGLADHGRGLAGHGGLVDRGDALDHRAVAGDELAGLDHHHVAARRARRPAFSPPSRRRATVSVRIARSASACALPRPSASASARLANTTVSHSQSGDGEGEPGGLVAAAERLAAEGLLEPAEGRDGGADLDHEHDRVAHTGRAGRAWSKLATSAGAAPRRRRGSPRARHRGLLVVKREVELEHVHAGLAEHAERRGRRCSRRRARAPARASRPRCSATRRAWMLGVRLARCAGRRPRPAV